MIYWAMLLHFYQPPTQIHSILDKVSDESYRPLIAVLKANPGAKITVNINGCLTEMLAEHNKSDILQGLDYLASQNQIEFTGSGKYHPILPLIPQTEIIRQISENWRTNRKLIGSSFQPRGFFTPEMCFGINIVDPVLSTGHDWIILGGIACPIEWPVDIIHYVNSSSGTLSVFFRDDTLSNRISFQEIDVPGFIKHLLVFSGDREEDIYIITAMDAETFGHHIKKWEKDFLDALYKELFLNNPDLKLLLPITKRQEKNISQGQLKDIIKPVTISEVLDHFKAGKAIRPKDSSWSTSIDDLQNGNPYPLWNNPGNKIHQLLWEHVNLTIEMVNKAVSISDNDITIQYAGIARELLDRALHSDQFWWATNGQHWDINLIYRGLALQQECLLNAYRAIRLSNVVNEQEKKNYHYRHIASEDIANTIRRQLFDS
jgi:alpha-amylase/alpha-mannosidase (GH57 family)